MQPHCLLNKSADRSKYLGLAVSVILWCCSFERALAADCLGGSIAGGTTTIDLNTEAAHVANLCTVSAGARYVLDASSLNSPSAGRYAVFATITSSAFSGGSGLGLRLRQPGDAASRLASAVIVYIAGNTFAESALQITGTFPPGSRVTVANNTLTITSFLCVLAGLCSQPSYHTALHLFPALEVLANATVVIHENTATVSSSSSNNAIAVLMYDVFATEAGSQVSWSRNTLEATALVGGANPHCSHLLCGGQLDPGAPRGGRVNVSGDGGMFLVEENRCVVDIASTTANTVAMHFACGDVHGSGWGVFAVRRNNLSVTSVLKYMDTLSLATATLSGNSLVTFTDNLGTVSGGANLTIAVRSSLIRSVGNAMLYDDARLVVHRNTFRAITCPDGGCIFMSFVSVSVMDRAAIVATANTAVLPSAIVDAGYFLFTSLALPSAAASVYFGRNVVSSGVVTSALVGGPMAAGINPGTVFVCANTEAGGRPLMNLASDASVRALVTNNCTATATASSTATVTVTDPSSSQTAPLTATRTQSQTPHVSASPSETRSSIPDTVSTTVLPSSAPSATPSLRPTMSSAKTVTHAQPEATRSRTHTALVPLTTTSDTTAAATTTTITETTTTDVATTPAPNTVIPTTATTTTPPSTAATTTTSPTTSASTSSPTTMGGTTTITSPPAAAPCGEGAVLVGSVPPTGPVLLRLPVAQPAVAGAFILLTAWTCGDDSAPAAPSCEVVEGGAALACSVGLTATADPVTCTAHTSIGCANMTLIVTAWPQSAATAATIIVAMGAASAGASVLLVGDPTVVEMPAAATVLLGPCASFAARDTARVAAFLFSPLHAVGQPEAVVTYVGGSALLAAGHAAAVGLVAVRRASPFIAVSSRLWFPNAPFTVATALYPAVAWAVAASARQGGSGAWAVAVGCVFLLAVPCVAAWLILRAAPAAFHAAPDLAQRSPLRRLFTSSGAFAVTPGVGLSVGWVRGVVAGRGRMVVVPACCVSVAVAWLAAGAPRGSSCAARMYAACALLAGAAFAVAVARPLRVPAANILSAMALGAAALIAFGITREQQPAVVAVGAVVVAVASVCRAAVTAAACVMERHDVISTAGDSHVDGEAEMALAPIEE